MKYYKFKPLLKTLIWGTESWQISGVPGNETPVADSTESSTSCVSDGSPARTLNDLVREQKDLLVGQANYQRFGDEFPLLVKFIDAHQDLSIQVHPDDEMAKRKHNKFGKSEMWYILDAEPGAYLYAGFKEQITPEQYKERVANGTITEVLAKHEVHKGDVFYLPSGRVHAICGGIKLAEIQQSSDVTYRIFDYNRPGLDGKPRELHTELAANAIDYTVYPEYKTPHEENVGEANELLNTPFFSIKIVETKGPFHRNMIKYDSFIIIMNIGEPVTVRVRATGDEVLVPAESSCLIPAAIADYELIPVRGTAKVMEAFINNKKSIGKTVKDFFHMLSNR